ncbi:SMI1/KNR4 family protein [Orbaceae bacterium ESL0721]|nr:SMI1/KNR4 family protein [Orbaceae bacterium ESL0721]
MSIKLFLNIIDGFGKLSNSKIEHIENELKISFPDDYKQFLANYNGGLPKQNYLTQQLAHRAAKVTLGVLLGVNSNPNYDLLDWNAEYRTDMPSDAFIIGVDYSSGLYIMMTDQENRGIYYWDNAYVLEHSNDDENVYFISTTFTEFMQLWALEV